MDQELLQTRTQCEFAAPEAFEPDNDARLVHVTEPGDEPIDEADRRIRGPRTGEDDPPLA
ncbi:ferredoxin [Streptosporangium sandarakinum]